MEECFQSLQSFKENKSPGNDGLTVEFYKTFWGVLCKLLVESLNCAFDYGELSNSQKQAIITLIEKKGKDKRQISNWRPISLIKLDAKIGSKAIARRLQEVIPDIIHHNQNAGSKVCQSGSKVVKPVFKSGQTGFAPEFRDNAYVMGNVTKGPPGE